MKALKAYFYIAVSQGSKVLFGFILIKLVALNLGPTGVGEISNFMSFVSAIVSFAGGGILIAIIKYVAEYKNDPPRLDKFIKSSFTYATIVSFGILIAALFLSQTLSFYIFGTKKYYYLIILTSIFHFLFAYTHIIVGYLNGKSETKTFSKISLISSLISITLAVLLISTLKFVGAAVAMLLTNATAFFVGIFYVHKIEIFRKIQWLYNKAEFTNLLKYSMMLASSAILLPGSEIIVRNLIVDGSGYEEVGYLQVLLRLSTVYVSFMSLFLSYHYMPQLSSEQNPNNIRKIVLKYLCNILILFSTIATLIYYLRYPIIEIALSDQFFKSAEYIKYQLVADFFKIGSYVISALGVAKARYRLYIGGELAQGVGLCLFMYLFSGKSANIMSAYQAIMTTYAVYFLLTLAFFFYYSKKDFKPLLT